MHCYDVDNLTPDQIRHHLDERWATFEIGNRHFTIPRHELHSIKAAREVAQALAAQASMWDRELAVIEEAAVAAEQAAATPETPEPLQDPTAAPDPTPAAEDADAPVDEPFGGDDPALDAQVARVVAMPETRRKTTAKEEL